LPPKKIGDNPLEDLDTGLNSTQLGNITEAQLDQSGDLKRLIGSLAITLLSVSMLVGGFLLSQANKPVAVSSPTLEAIATVVEPSVTPTPSLASTATTIPATATATPTDLPPTDVPTSEPTATPVPPTPTQIPSTPTQIPPTMTAQVSQPLPQPTRCALRTDWCTYTVNKGETLFSLSRRCNSTVAVVQQANCMAGSSIYAGQIIYLPCQALQPTSLPTAVPPSAPTIPPTQPDVPPPTPGPAPTTSVCIRPTIVEFYAAPPSSGSGARFSLHWVIQGADRAEIFGHSVNPQSGSFEVWDTEVQFWTLWAKADYTPDDCYTEHTLQIDPDAVN